MSMELTARRIRAHAGIMTETTEVEVVAPAKKKAGRPKGVKRAASKLTQGELAMVVLDFTRGMPQGEIARKMGVSDSAVSLILDKFKPAFAELHNVEEYRKAKADILDSVQLQTLKSMACPDKQASANLGHLANAFDVLNKHARLERGLSTQNVATQTVSIALTPGEYTEPS